jgi:hypothetical protein
MNSPDGSSRPANGSAKLVLTAFTVAVFTSALLLFAVQPMFTRMVLPRLGGSPSVWSVAMVFFQAMLLAGYVYAHLLTKYVKPAIAVGIHLVVLIGAAFTLPLSIAQSWGDPPSATAAFWLLGLFTVSIGLPFFAISANNPLLQAWFARTGHPDSSNPYFLYAASNIGSFLALLSYPLLLEPMLSLRDHNRLWTGGFIALIVMIAICGAILLRSPTKAVIVTNPFLVTPPPKWRAIAHWAFVASVPSGLLVAVTAHISTDIAAAPLMWVIPLSLYLLTWVLVFQSKPLLPQRWMLWAQLVALVGLVALFSYTDTIPLWLMLSGHLVAFFLIAVTCHGELAQNRPSAEHLTTFYVAISFGGMIGGLFAGLLAPYLFSWIAEYPILIALAALCRPARPLRWSGNDGLFWGAAVMLAVLLFISSRVFDWTPPDNSSTVVFAVTVVIAAIAFVMPAERLKIAMLLAIALSMAHIYRFEDGTTERLRSFFGVYKVTDTADDKYRVLTHGTTVHGAQQIQDDDGAEIVGRPKPLTYYHEKSPMAQSIRAIRARKGGPIKVAVIGLGAGSLACYRASGEAWKFFEIDPLIVKISRDDARFTFVKDCAPDVPIVLGDARLTLTHEPDKEFDLIIVDAYSSDAIPIHLATREAMALYASKLAPGGAVVLHISNRHLELSQVALGIADANGLRAWHYNTDTSDDEDDRYMFSSEVVIVAKLAQDIGTLADDSNWEPMAPDPKVRVWTDDYSNIIGALWRRYQQ